MEATGNIVFVDLSGGFWGIESDDGNKYMPLDGVPKRFQEKGKRVKITFEPSDALSIYMWGQNINLSDIKAL